MSTIEITSKIEALKELEALPGEEERNAAEAVADVPAENAEETAPADTVVPAEPIAVPEESDDDSGTI